MKYYTIVFWMFFIVLCSTYSCSNTQDKIKVVAIQPIGNNDAGLCDLLKQTIQERYLYEVIILESIKPPEEAFVNVKTPRYRADKLISYLRKHKPKSADFIIGVTNYDISTTKRNAFGIVKSPKSKYEDFGIYGLGYMPGPACILSTYRLKGKDSKIFESRVCKIAVHELGHNHGLPHCPNPKCVMADAAESIKTIDAASIDLCEECRRKT
jgi:archaemetzincin